MQITLFDIKDNKRELTSTLYKPNPLDKIEGLQYVENFISDEEHNELLSAINKSVWLSDLKRRVQHYGYKYDYKKRSLNYSMYLGDMPEWIEKISNKIVCGGYIDTLPDQVIINEYKPGQGIADHIDCEPCFKDTIISLSLASSCIMEFKNKNDKTQKHELLLQPKSLIVIKGESRYGWTHGIPAREKDKWQDKIINRATRVSLTFRKVILADTQKHTHLQAHKS